MFTLTGEFPLYFVSKTNENIQKLVGKFDLEISAGIAKVTYSFK